MMYNGIGLGLERLPNDMISYDMISYDIYLWVVNKPESRQLLEDKNEHNVLLPYAPTNE